jgi:hypothetical protein
MRGAMASSAPGSSGSAVTPRVASCSGGSEFSVLPTSSRLVRSFSDTPRALLKRLGWRSTLATSA